MAGLYLHIPFCKQACHYCDFHFSTNQASRGDLIRAMRSEMLLQRDYLNGDTISTIYVGGGTPSLLEKDELDILLKGIHESFSLADQPEITLEANPDDLTQERIETIQESGVNRLSVGIQSFDDNILKFLNRAHNSTEAIQSIRSLRKAGFNNISVDLIYGIPGLALATWKENIQKAIDLAPEHISTYALTIEKKTAFGKWMQTGKFTPLAEGEVVEHYEWLMELLDTAGYEQYEISNFSRPGFNSRHNTSYWQQVPYLGIGPSAHSYNRISRQHTISNNELYRKGIEAGELKFEREVLTRENKINEFIFTTLRTSWGCDLEKLRLELGFDLQKANSTYLETLKEQSLATLQNNALVLTRRGRLLADQIASDLFINPN